MNDLSSQELRGQPAGDVRTQAFLTHLMAKSILDQPGLQRVKSAMASTGQGAETILLELGLIEEPRLADEGLTPTNYERQHCPVARQ